MVKLPLLVGAALVLVLCASLGEITERSEKLLGKHESYKMLRLSLLVRTALVLTPCILLVSSFTAVDVVKTYVLVEKDLTWPEAQSYCRTHHKDLVSIHSKEEVNTILKEYTYKNISASFLWIGLQENASKDQWLWTSGETVNFYNWGFRQPNKFKMHEHCVLMSPSGEQHDYPCNNPRYTFYFVCFSGSQSSGEMKYHYIKEKKSWFGARDTCRERYTDLVSITSQQELEKIRNITGGKKVWIGLYQNPWRWSNGDESSFQYWDTNEPNNRADICVGMWLKSLPNKRASSSSSEWTLALGPVHCTVFIFITKFQVRKVIEFNCNMVDLIFFFFFFAVTSRVTLNLRKEYILVKESLTWPDAQNYCRTHHKDLVSIHSKEEVKLLLEKLGEVGANFAWIGLQENANKDQWLWTSGETVNFYNWGFRQPNKFKKHEHCVLMSPSGKQHDYPCNNPRYAFYFGWIALQETSYRKSHCYQKYNEVKPS
nr:PREDICTED: macrophage mannose receptor 1-like [Latimeria chalumnae]|eukprot:XP_014339379.1 PREDICTED: macrophage mannose receptor 1-like [Latimeria chalumnae]